MFLNDQETATDLLYYEPIARTVVRFIRETPIAPITLGVHGDWGAGKSSVLKMTEAAFKDDERILCIWFNGWTFEGFEDAKTVVIETIVEELRRARPTSKKVAEAAKKVLRRVDWLKVAQKAGGFAFNAFTGMPTLDQARGLLGTVTSFLSKPQDQITVEDLKDIAAHAQELVKEEAEDADRLPTHIHEFRKEFSALLDAADLDRLVVIVDDLDRCLPKTAISTLEAIRLFLMVDRTAFVIGADELMIEYAVREHFPDLPPSTGPVSYPRNYLEKLIQVPFRVPALGVSETRAYITLLLAEVALTANDRRFQKLLTAAREDMRRPWKSRGLDPRTISEAMGSTVPPEVAQAQQISTHLTRLLTEGTHGNPRQIKRFLNSMMLRQAIAHERGFGDDIKLPVLGKIMLAERFYPDFYKQLTQLVTAESGKPAALQQFESSIRSSAGAPLPKQGADSTSVTADKQATAKAPTPAAAAEPAEVADWSKNEWIKGWAAIDPPLAEVDLLPYIFVTRDKRGALAGIAASAHLEGLVSRLMGSALSARGCASELAGLTPQELDEVFNAVSEQILQSDMQKEPKGVQGLLVIAERGPELGRRVLEFARALDVSSTGVWPLNLIAGLKHPELVDEARTLLAAWAEGENKTLAQAVSLMGKLAKKG